MSVESGWGRAGGWGGGGGGEVGAGAGYTADVREVPVDLKKIFDRVAASSVKNKMQKKIFEYGHFS